MLTIDEEDEIHRKNKRAEHWEMYDQSQRLWDQYEQSVNDINACGDNPFQNPAYYASMILSNHFGGRHGTESLFKSYDWSRVKTEEIRNTTKAKVKDIALTAAQLGLTIAGGFLGISSAVAPVSGASGKVLEQGALMARGIGEAGTSGIKQLNDAGRQADLVLLNAEAEAEKQRITDIERARQNAKDQVQKFIDQQQKNDDKEHQIKEQLVRPVA